MGSMPVGFNNENLLLLSSIRDMVLRVYVVSQGPYFGRPPWVRLLSLRICLRPLVSGEAPAEEPTEGRHLPELARRPCQALVILPSTGASGVFFSGGLVLEPGDFA